MSAQQFMEMLFGQLPDFFKNDEELRALWSAPDTRAKLLAGLAEKGFGKDQLSEMQKIIDAEKSDLFDVLAYVAYALPTLSREERATKACQNVVATMCWMVREGHAVSLAVRRAMYSARRRWQATASVTTGPPDRRSGVPQLLAYDLLDTDDRTVDHPLWAGAPGRDAVDRRRPFHSLHSPSSGRISPSIRNRSLVSPEADCIGTSRGFGGLG
jgi:hypothetical protein